MVDSGLSDDVAAAAEPGGDLRADSEPAELAASLETCAFLRLAREGDLRFERLFRQGAVAKWYSSVGHEATTVSAGAVLEAGDALFSLHRDSGAILRYYVDIDDVPRLYAQEGEGGAGPGGPQPGVSTDPCDGPSACDCVLDDIVETVGGQPCNITLPSGNTVAGWQKITDYTHYFDCSPIIGCGHVICPDATDTFTEYGLCVPNSIGRMGHELRKKLPF